MNTHNQLHTLAVEDVYTALATSADGLGHDEAEARLQQYGRNMIHEAKRVPIVLRFLANFTHLMALLLWAGGVVALIAQLPQLAVAIWLVNVINGVFSFWQEYRAEKATEALRRLLPMYSRVLRGGEERRLLAEVLVPGDVIFLAEGDYISADARLIHVDGLQVDQATLTGESYPVAKAADPVLEDGSSHFDVPNAVFAGTTVSAGAGRAVVFATGMGTELGKIAGLTQSVGDEISPLQKEIAVATRVVTVIAVGVGLLFFVMAMFLAGMNQAESFIFGLGMIVAFVPEGLLPTITLSLAMGVQRMVKRHALVKRLSSVETLGCTTVICTDKTGTLTENEMTVHDLWVADQWLTVTGVGYGAKGQILAGGKPVPGLASRSLHQLLLAAVQCNDARLVPPQPGSDRWTVLGDPTEAALQVAAVKGGLDMEVEFRRRPRLCELPFDSRRKRMSTIHSSGSGRVAYVKGAPSEVLALSTHMLVNGRPEPLDTAFREHIMAVNDDYARVGLRVLGVAQRELPEPHNGVNGYTPEDVERDLTFIGLAAMIDPPRVGVAEAVDKCHRAGIRVIMVTGDYGLTAESIARRVGIVRGGDVRVVTGADLKLMSDDALKDVLQSDVIFARAAPEHKLRIVRALQELGHVVAVTGDGVNDAPALKKADIGVAMGVVGTDVAKEAADMILTDDNFASIVDAIEEGRAVYANIKKFITYIFTSNAPEAVPFIVSAFTKGRVPLALNIMQVLAIDLGTDMVPALALGREPPEPGLMDRPPRSRHEHVITPAILARAYLWLGLIQGLIAMIAFYFMYWTSGYWGQWLDLPGSGDLYRAATAMTLAAVVATQIGNVFAQRTERISVFRIGLFSNRLVWVGIAVEVLLILLIVYLPFLQGVFGTAVFPPQNWLFLLAWTPALLLADEGRKAFLRWRWARRVKPVRA